MEKRTTESSSQYQHLERMTTLEILKNINNEDHKIAEVVGTIIPRIEKLVSKIVPRFQKGGRLFYIGAGSSGRMGILDASEIPPTFGLPHDRVIGIIAGGDKAIRKAVEFAEDDMELGWHDLKQYQINEKDTLIGIAASGSTPYVIGALVEARKHNILTACITNNKNSPLANVSDIAIEVVVGPEFLTGSTRMKSGTAQKMVLNMISTSLMIKVGRVSGNKMINMQLSNNKLIDRGIRFLMDELKVSREIAAELLLKYGSVKEAINNSLNNRELQ